MNRTIVAASITDSRTFHLRYALYFTPPEEDSLTQAAARWLGRDAFSDHQIAHDPVDGLPDGDLQDLLADPRRYGFHATIKAPFELAEGASEAHLLSAFEAFCSRTEAFDIPKVVVGQLGPFFAIIPDRIYPVLQTFAASVVEEFEPFRAPLSEADIARRRPERLSDSQRANLMRWGYHHVMDDFRFHMTLTGPADPGIAPILSDVLNQRFADFVNRPLTVSGLGLFVEESRGAPFTVKSWLPLRGA
ncbi:DUF1045 domain-containing protein [Agrobacterium sp. a22-2]|uniref:DUF1045 domain-containing protein n=1 Tax=Agrobacterium sp. a22-2 TaxID=2283840 RepID=UPI001447E9C6|nr:DUF1045 domain-containing protein [Agrobacterium sp. a22-2]NKN37136.1 DUF1045 domain-containing protein [Agrobacterium sp. a22-2]